MESYSAKIMHGQILRQKDDIRHEASWNWLKRGDLKKETEGLITAPQDQTVRTNAVKLKIEKKSICKAKEETVS